MILKINCKNSSSIELPIKGISSLPKDFKRSLSINETKDGKFFLCISESLIGNPLDISSIEFLK